MLRVGGLSLTGLTLPFLLEQTALGATKPAKPASRSFGKAKRCIMLYLSGGPAQLDTFDPKPDAPEQIRGEFTHHPDRRAPACASPNCCRSARNG